MWEADRKFVQACIAWLRKKGQATTADELETKLKTDDSDIANHLRRVLRNKPDEVEGDLHPSRLRSHQHTAR